MSPREKAIVQASAAEQPRPRESAHRDEVRKLQSPEHSTAPARRTSSPSRGATIIGRPDSLAESGSPAFVLALSRREGKGMTDTRPADVSSPGAASPESAPSLDLTSAQFSWMRSELSNVRTLLSWTRTSVSMIGFGFTIYNFYSGIFDEVGGTRGHEAARNLGLALVAAGTLAMVIALWNYWNLNHFLESTETALRIPSGLKRRWIYAYVLSAVMMGIGLITFLFMLRVI
jgi:putative membrane protein